MKLLTRYLLLSLIGPLALCLAGFYFLLIFQDLYGNLDDFIHSESNILDICRLYLIQFPRFAQMIVPGAFLFSSLYVMGMLSRNRELIAMQSAGIGIASLSIPFFLIAGLLSAFLYFFNIHLGPSSEEKRRDLESTIKGQEPQSAIYREVVHVDPTTKTMWYLQKIDLQTQTFTQGEILLRDPQKGDRVKYFAAQGTYRDGFWDLANVRIFDYQTPDGSLKIHTESQLDVRELTTPPQKLVAVMRPPDQLSWPELLHFLHAPTRSSPNRMAPYWTEHYYRMAYPLIPFLIAFFVIGLGVTHTRRNVAGTIFNTLLYVFGCLIWNMFCLALGRGNRIPPPIAAFNSVLFFGMMGFYLYANRVGWIADIRHLFAKKKEEKSALQTERTQ